MKRFLHINYALTILMRYVFFKGYQKEGPFWHSFWGERTLLPAKLASSFLYRTTTKVLLQKPTAHEGYSHLIAISLRPTPCSKLF